MNASGREWRIGIDKPTGGFAAAGDGYEAVVSFVEPLTAIATSGNYRNTFTDETGRTRVHTIDPKTGTAAPSEILSVSIAAAECAVADAWATGIMASGTLENARRLAESAPDGIEYYVIYSDAAGSAAVFHSERFPLAK